MRYRLFIDRPRRDGWVHCLGVSRTVKQQLGGACINQAYMGSIEKYPDKIHWDDVAYLIS